jgi:uncharacterized Zn-binding protein involved in type VI secretion
MIPTVIVNGLTIVHKDSDGVAVCSAPDVCNTPGAGPVPYINVAYSRGLVKGSVTVKVDGQPAALKESEFLPSYGDEPGTGGGVISGVNRGKAKFTNYSFDVKIEGRNVARLTDSMSMNGNGPNTCTTAELQSNLGKENVDILCKAFCKCNDLNKPVPPTYGPLYA